MESIIAMFINSITVSSVITYAPLNFLWHDEAYIAHQKKKKKKSYILLCNFSAVFVSFSYSQ